MGAELELAERTFALVLPGEAMWGPFQTGFAVQMGEILRAAGKGDQPFSLAVGSSSGSLVAAIAAAGAPFDHKLTRDGWIEFGYATRLLGGGRLNPYPGALADIFDRRVIDAERAFRSPTRLVMTASHYNRHGVEELREAAFAMAVSALQLMVAGASEGEIDLTKQAAAIVQAGTHLFAPRYFTTRPWTQARPPSPESSPRSSPRASDEEWIQVASPEHLRRAIEASSRIPLLYGDPISDGAHLFIDGVFADNAPVSLAVASGATDIIVVSSSRKGRLFNKPVQSMFCREILRLIAGVRQTAARLQSFPGGDRLAGAVAELDRIATIIPRPEPIDLADLRSRHPGRRISVVHPQNPPRVNRFLESDPRVLGRIYDMGREAAEHFTL